MDARPLNLVRPDVPAELAALVAKMMAKDPGRRFQTPKEVAQALAPFLKEADEAPPIGGGASSQAAQEAEDRPGDGGPATTTEAEPYAVGPGVGTPEVTEPATHVARKVRPNVPREDRAAAEVVAPAASRLRLAPWLWLSVAAGVVAMGLGAAWQVGLLRQRDAGRGPAGVDPPTVSKGDVKPLQAPPPTGPGTLDRTAARRAEGP